MSKDSFFPKSPSIVFTVISDKITVLKRSGIRHDNLLLKIKKQYFLFGKIL
jgi:hypothetical protein